MSETLFDAIRAGDTVRLAELLGADPNAHAEAPDGFTPLQTAISELDDARNVDAIVLLLRHGAQVNNWDRHRESTPLLMAVFRNQGEAVRMLLAAGADPNVRGDEGYSPLRFCAQEGFVEMARLLLLCGATKTINEWGGERAMTALGLAARGLHVEMVKLLLAFGADPHARDVDRFTALDCLRLVDAAEAAAQDRLEQIRRLLGAAAREDSADG
ncbi:MAG: ankyrin repeat domain-containing protein [Polyangiaceae bacterium]|nr:ankyrin repeat domain-containing protein [Polyangiaceae bacterium]